MTARQGRTFGLGRVVSSLAGLVAIAALPGLVIGADRSFEVMAPGLHLDPDSSDGTQVCEQGFVVRFGERRIIGDGLRFRLGDGATGTGDLLWAQGRILYQQPGILIEAQRLGLRDVRSAEPRGDAWDVHATIELPARTLPPGFLATAATHAAPRRLRLRADRLQLAGHVLTFLNVEVDGGHGGMAAFHVARVVVFLRREAEPDRQGPARNVSGIAMHQPGLTLAGVPALWLPYLYRDFVIDYPWTRAEAGHSNRIGTYARWWIGSGIPPVANWRTWVTARLDANSADGEGVGAQLRWHHPHYGVGAVDWLRFDQAKIPDPANDRNDTSEASLQVIDAQHRLNRTLGAAGMWTISGRYVSISDQALEQSPVGTFEARPGERFRSDYLADSINHDPEARQSVAGAVSLPWLTAFAETRRQISVRDPATERWADVRLGLMPLRLFGPVHVHAAGEVAELQRPLDRDAATRHLWSTDIGLGQWLGESGFGIDLRSGWRGLGYSDGRLAGVDQADSDRGHSESTATLRYRLIAVVAEYTHTVTPRVGVEFIGTGRGDLLPTWRFDRSDAQEEDRHYLTTGLATTLSRVKDGVLLRADVAARFGLRQSDRVVVDGLGVQQESDSSLADVTVSIEGRPLPELRLRSDAVYDRRLRAWTRSDNAVSWQATNRVGMAWAATLVPDAAAQERWQHRPELTLDGNRYRLQLGVDLLPEGPVIDLYRATLTRKMIEGDLSFTYWFVHGVDDQPDDHRVGVGFSLGGDLPRYGSP